MRNKGMTYQAISDSLKNDYGIEKSRQAVQGLYVRTIEDRENFDSETELAIKCDIINIYCLGYNMTQVTNLVSNFWSGITYQKVISIIKSNGDYIDSVENAMLARLSDKIDTEDNPNILRSMLSYRDISVTDSRFSNLINQITLARIKRYATLQISRAYKLTGNKADAKELCKTIGVVSITNIENNIKNL